MSKNCILKSNPKFQKIAAIYTVPIAEILVHKYNESISGEELFYPEVKTLNTWITQSKTEQIKNLREILDSETGLTTKALVSLLQGIVSKYEGVYMVTRGNLHGGGLVNRAFHEEFTFGTNLRLMQELERDYPQHFEVVPVPKNKYSYIIKINPARLSKPTVEQLKLFNVENSNQLGVTSKQHLEQLFENNTELTAKAVLNNIKKAQPHLKNLVNKLESLVSENTIVSLDESTGYSTPFGTANAYFNKVNGNIGIAKNALFSKTPEAVILHEILHAVSHDKLKIDDNANYQFNLLLEYVTDELGLENFEYALQNRDEFLAAVLTDPAFAEALSSIKAIDSKNQNIFEQIINYILKLINTTKIDNAYDQAVSLINEILELQSDNTVSPGVSEVFKMAPELANIGTPEQYSQYLNTIFPNSLIKDIVFHGTGYGEKITSLRNRSYFSTLDTASEYAAWDESNRIEYAFSQGLPESEIKAKAQLVPALINLVNPKRLDGVNYKETEKDYPGHDGIYSENTVDPLTGNELQIVVFDSKNTHVLGSPQDIEGFKKFVGESNSTLYNVDQPSKEAVLETKENLEDTILSNPDTIYVLEADEQGNIYTTETGVVKLDNYSNVHLITTAVDFNSDKSFTPEESKRIKDRLESDLDILEQISTDDSSVSVMDNNIGTHLAGKDSNLKNFLDVRLSNQIGLKRESSTDSQLVEAEESDLTIENIDSENLQDEELLQKLDPKKQEEAKSIQFVTEIVDRLIANLGMPEGSVNFITAQEAKELTANAKNPYNGEPAFFYKGKIYFVDGQFNFSTAIHEISHPFIKSIRYQNPQLFNKLFNDLYATETGKLVAQESTEDYYDNFNEEVSEKELNDDIKEETIVRFFSEILEAVLNDQDAQIGSSPKEQSAIAKIIMDILYALKKLFRQVVGKGSKIEKLKADTTLKELANLLATEQFQVDMSIVSQEDIVDYINNQKKLNKELRDVLTNSPGRSEIFKAVNETSVMYRKLLDELRKNGDIFMLNAVLEENWDGSTLVTDLAKAAREVKYENVLKKLAREENALEEIAIVGNNIVRILAGQEKILENVKNRLDYLSKQSLKNDKLVVNELNTYRNHLKNVLEFTESFSKIAEEIEIDEQDEIFKEIRALESKAKRRLKDINKIHEKIILPVLKSVWDSYMGATTIQLKSQKEKLEKALQEEGAYKAGIQRSLNNINDQLSKIDLGLEAFKEHAFGKRGDINPLSSWFESYIAQQDPTIASFAAYVKGELSDAQNEEYARFNSLRNKLKALEKELGISPSDINKYAEEFLTADVVKISNDQDELIDFEVYALLNPFKNTENTLRGMYVNIENLRDKVEEGEPGALEELEKAEAKLKLHKALFYNNEMIDEYYFVDNTLLTNPDVDGAALLAKVNEKQTEMKALHSQRMVTNDALELKVLQDEIKQKRFEIKELYSDYSNGVKKTAQELKDAKALREWREAKSKYYDFALKKGDFEKALSGYEQTVIATLENQNLDQETINEILAEKRKEWISQNTRVVIKQEFYEKKARYLETLNSINEQIEESLQKDKTISDMVGSSVYYNNKLYKVSYKNGEYLFTRENEDPISFDVDATTLINSLGAQVPTRKIFDLNREYIFQSLLGKKDENGEYMVTELSEEHLAAIKEMQEEIEKDKEFLINNNGLTSAEMRELSGYFEIRQRGEQLASKDFNRYKELLDKKNKFKIDPALKRQLLVYSRLLNELQTKEASSYYIDYLNDNFYDLFLSQDLVEQGEIRLDNIESILNIEVANALMEASAEFKEWFEKNHYIAEVYVEDGIYEEMYQRIEPWNKIVPTDPADYESFQITRQDGSEETIPGLPTTDYYQRELKNEYKLGYNPQTGLVENSQYKDISNRFTPKNLEQMQEMVKKYPEYFANSEYTWDHYINKKYYDVMEAGGPKAEILKSILEYHQESQKGLDDNQMLGYYLPRFRADLYENLTSDDRESIGDRLSEFWEKTASQFMVRKDDYQESSFNFAETVYAADKIVYRTDSEKIPIQGKYLLEKKQVSRDVFHVLGAYALSAAENKRLKKSNHMARFLQTVAAENKPYDKIQTNSIKDQAKQKIKNNKMLLSGRDNFRSATIDAMVESIYEGKQIATDSPLYTSIAKFTQPLTSIGVFSFFAFDLHSAFKNYLGARSMVALESINSRFFSYKSHLMATPWAHKVMFNISNEIYTKGANSLEVQMMMAFDAFQGRFKQKFATSPGRKFARDLVNFTWTSNTRQYLEIATNVETFAAILHHIKLEQETSEGKKTIRYVDAWELNPETKTLQLKPGIDKKYDIDGEEFIKVKAAAQEHNNFAQGVYAQFDSTRIERTVYGSMSMRMKKFFIKMAINRFSGAFDGDRTNLATGRVESGFYVKAVKTLKRLMQSGGKDFNYLQADEKKAMIQTLVDLLKGYILYEVILLGMMLGFDFDDEDRFSKMRERSGALPTPFTDPSHSKDWKFTGWFNNNLALLLLNTHEEVTFFHTPKSVIGTAKEWSPVTEGSAAEAVISIGKDLVDGLNPWAGMDVYSRTVGGLNVQQKNEYKIWMKIYKLIGLKGKAIDPVTQMKNKSTMRRLKTGAKKQEEDED